MSITNLVSYQELDDDMKESYPIDDIWDDVTRTFKQKKLFLISRVSGNIVLTIDKSESKSLRIVCRDPRVGCTIYKMHISNPIEIVGVKKKIETCDVKKNIIAKDVGGKKYTSDYFYEEQIKYAKTVPGRRANIKGQPIHFKGSNYETPSVEYIRSFRKY